MSPKSGFVMASRAQMLSWLCSVFQSLALCFVPGLLPDDFALARAFIDSGSPEVVGPGSEKWMPMTDSLRFGT